MGRVRGLCFRRLFLGKGSSYFSVCQLPGGTGREPRLLQCGGTAAAQGKGFWGQLQGRANPGARGQQGLHPGSEMALWTSCRAFPESQGQTGQSQQGAELIGFSRLCCLAATGPVCALLITHACRERTDEDTGSSGNLPSALGPPTPTLRPTPHCRVPGPHRDSDRELGISTTAHDRQSVQQPAVWRNNNNKTPDSSYLPVSRV